MKKISKITRKKAREHLGQLNLSCELAKIIRHCFPGLVTLLKQAPDPRSQSYTTYPGVVLLMTRILSSVFYISSMRKKSEGFNSDTVIENIWELCGKEQTVMELPYWETINRYLEKLDHNSLQKIQQNGWEEGCEEAVYRYDYVTGIDYKGNRINLAAYGETRKRKIQKGMGKGTTKQEKKEFWFITNLPVSRKNVKSVIERGRMRWKIENEGVNTQKNHGYHLEHRYSKNYHAYKNHYYLIQIGHMIAQIMEVYEKLRKGMKQGREQKHRRILEPFKTVRPREYSEELEVMFQIRFQ